MKTINPTSMAAPFGRYSHAVLVSQKQRLLKTSGQLALSLDKQIPQSAYQQATLIFQNLARLLEQAQMQKSDIIHLTAYVTDRQYMAEYMQARDEFLGNITPPASTLLIVSGFTLPEFKVEIELTATAD
ncbi:RidA family protein [Gayadomonas joobiniege]|uniref:RidA family protein n=1 Tax=Gayadomonas joobiniege TaxID=1234606 RepID=UPI0003744698|nr:RidA family protein [Gayadomonas joobiniege]